MSVDPEALVLHLLREHPLMSGVTVNSEYADIALTSPGFLEVRSTEGGERRTGRLVEVPELELVAWSNESRVRAARIARDATAALRDCWKRQIKTDAAAGWLCSFNGSLTPVQVRLGGQPATTYRYRSVVSVGVRTPNNLLGV